MNTKTGNERTLVYKPKDSAGSPNADPTEDIATGERDQRRIFRGGDARPNVIREDAYAPEIGKRNPSQNLLNPTFSAGEARAGRRIARRIRKMRSRRFRSKIKRMYSVRM